MPKTQINPNKYDYEITENDWVVSVLSAPSKKDCGRHAIIVVEGLKKNDTTFPEVFVGQYDLMIANWDSEQKSLINETGHYYVRSFESNKYGIDYTKLSSISWKVSAKKTKEMITDIKKEILLCEAAKIKLVEFPKYQKLGEDNSLYLLVKDNGGHNCASWCRAKLAICDIDVSGNWIEKNKPSKLTSDTTSSSASSTNSSCAVM